MEGELEDKRKSFNLFRAIYNQSDAVLISGSILLSMWMTTLWLLPHIDYLPDWFPVPSPSNQFIDLLKCFQPIILCIFGIPTIIAFIIEFTASISIFVGRLQTYQTSNKNLLILSLIVLVIPALLWVFSSQIDKYFLDYGISRYDVVIDEIEKYKKDKGVYPPNLAALVPEYIPKRPGIYMKFGEELTYEPKPYAWYDHSPFTFELYGHYLSMHGQTLKYCPINTCYFEGDRHYAPVRINDRWIWVYSSAL